MNKYTIAVIPNANSTGLKMSRDIELIAENDHFAKEQAQNMYPNAKVMIRRSVRLSSDRNEAGSSSSHSHNYSGLNLGGIIGFFLYKLTKRGGAKTED